MAGSAIATKRRPTRALPSRRAEAPPIVHALGGSIGSALALLLFYPLERARIELQSKAAAASSSSKSSSSVQSSSSSEEQSFIHGGDVPAVSPIRRADDSREEESSWDRAAPDSPSSWSMDSDSPADNTLSSYDADDSDDGENDRNRDHSDSIFKCLVDLKERGILYKGVKPIISTIFTSQFVFFFLHAYTKRSLVRLSPASTKASSPWLSLLSSCLAGVGNVLLTNPLWVTNMAIVSGATETQNLFRECLKLWKEHGPKRLWNGTDASLLLVSNPIIQFVCYEQFKRILLASKARRLQKQTKGHSRTNSNSTIALGPAEAFVIAALAKAIATVGTYPLQLTQTILRMSNHRKQTSIGGDDDEESDSSNERQGPRRKQRRQYNGTTDCLMQLYRTNNAGCAAWFTGMKAKLLQTVLTAAFTFLTYEQIVGVVQNVVMHTMRVQQKRVVGGTIQKNQ